MPYSVKISAKKGSVGAVDGIVASAVAMLVIGFLRRNAANLDPEVESAISGFTIQVVGVVVSAVVVATKKFTENWFKHRREA